jgi:hypothetical protein
MFGEHLEKRLKQMASDMIEACGKRYGAYRENEPLACEGRE